MPNSNKKQSLKQRGVKGLQIQIPEASWQSIMDYSQIAGICSSKTIDKFIDFDKLHSETKKLIQAKLKQLESK